MHPRPEVSEARIEGGLQGSRRRLELASFEVPEASPVMLLACGWRCRRLPLRFTGRDE
jgi:hypothetical protein